jgi:hypothetical protein
MLRLCVGIVTKERHVEVDVNVDRFIIVASAIRPHVSELLLWRHESVTHLWIIIGSA